MAHPEDHRRAGEIASGPPEDWLSLNRASWDERVPLRYRLRARRPG